MTRAIEGLAEGFWHAAGVKESYPRSLEKAVAWALPLAIVKVPGLSVCGVQDWLRSRGIVGLCEQSDRVLRACLVARFGYGMVFIDGTDSEDDQRFSLAHEVAHFILDYLQPRRMAIQAFGDSILGVLDGARRPTPEERLSGVLKGVVTGPYMTLMGRAEDNSIEEAVTLDSESLADQLAFELLAPQRAAYDKMRQARLSFDREQAPEEATILLATYFGLPRPIARIYATALVYRKRSTASFREWLGVPPRCRTLRPGSE